MKAELATAARRLGTGAAILWLLASSCSPSRVSAPDARGGLRVELTFPGDASAAWLSAARPGARLLASGVDGIRIRVFEITLLNEGESVLIGEELADQSIDLDSTATEFEIALQVREAMAYGVLAEAIGQRVRFEGSAPTAYGLQYAGVGVATAEEVTSSPVRVDLFDVVPQVRCVSGEFADAIEWDGLPSTLERLSAGRGYRVWTLGGDTTHVTGTRFVAPTRGRQYRVQADLYEDLFSAFSEPSCSAFESGTSAHKR